MLPLLFLMIMSTTSQTVFRNDLIFDVAPTCTKPGISIHYTKTVHCPCFITFGLSSIQPSNTRIDFLVLQRSEFVQWRRKQFSYTPPILDTFSFLNITTSAYSIFHKFHFFQTENLQLDSDDEYTLAIRSNSITQDCDIKILHIFEAQPTPCPTRLPRSQNVVAGIPAENAVRIHMASIISPSGTCSGTVISERYILTAAHCTADRGKVFIGGKNMSSGEEYEIVEFIRHPGYDRFQDANLGANDIALIRVSRDVDNAVRYSRNAPPDSVFVRAAGYGLINESWVTGGRELRMVDIPVMNFDECIERFVSIGAGNLVGGLVNDVHMCVGGSCGDTCYGDSGGPILVRHGEEYVQVGIVSGGIGCGRTGLPGIYTMVSGYSEWVESITGVSGVTVEFDVAKGMDGNKGGGGGGRMKMVGLGIFGGCVTLSAVLGVGLLVWRRCRRFGSGGENTGMTFTRRYLDAEGGV